MKSIKLPRIASRSALLLTAAALPSPVFADLTWNSAGATNVWSTAAGNTNWNAGGVVWTQNENAIFDGTSGTAETIDVATVNTFNDITFGATGFVVSSAGAGSLTLANDQASSITVTNAGDTATINETIANNAAGLSSLTKAGLGTLVLGGANTYTGQTTIAGGILKAGAAAALGAGGAGAETIVQSGATLDVNGQAITTTEIVRIAGTGVGGNGALINTGASQTNALNRVELTADASVGGSFRWDVRPGTTPTLDLAGFTLTKVGANQISIVGSTITSGHLVVNAGTLGIETTSLLQGTGTVTVNSGGILGLWGNTGTNVTRPITLNNGAVGNLGSTGTINSPITLNGGGTISSAGVTQTIAGNIDGTGPLNVTGTGAVQLNATGSYTGGTTITDARLQIGTNIAGVADGTITVNGDGVVPDGQFYMAGAATLPNTKSFIISGRGGNSVDGTQRGAIRVEAGAIINGNIALAANAAIGSNSGLGTLNGVISGAFELTKVDPQTLVLTGNNTYSGGTRVSAGTLQLDYNTADSTKLADGGVLTMAGGTLSLAGTASTTHTEAVASTTLAAGTASTITRTAGTANRIALGTITRESGATLNLAADSIATTTNTPVGGNLGSWLTVGGTSLATVNGSNEIVAVSYTDISTVTGILTDGLGDVRLTGAAGSVALGGSPGDVIDVGSLSRSVAGLATIDTTGKTLRLGQTGGVFSATGSGGITIGTTSNAGTLTAGGADDTAGTLDFNLVAGNVTVNSTITDNGTGPVSIVKAGTPDLILTGNNSYSGGTTLAGGLLRVGSSDNALGTGALTFTKNSTFASANGLGARNIANNIVINSGITGSIDSGYATLTLGGIISGAGNLATASSGTTILTGANTYAGTTNVVATNATLQVGNSGTTGNISAGSVTVTGTLAFNRSNPYNLNNTFATSAGTLRQDGTGMLNIQAAAALLPTNLVINGPVTLTGGGFSANRMNGNGVVTINATGTLTIPSGSAHALGGDNATMTESVVINGGTLTANQEQYLKTLTLNGATVNGTNEIRVAATPAFSVGGTAASTVSARVNNFNAVTWTVADATTSAAADLTISGQITGNGLTKAGPGTMVMSHATNNYAGTTAVNGGTLLVNGGKTGTGAVTVATGATLGGTGNIAGALSVVAGATIAPGASAGDLTVGATTLAGTYACEIDGANEDTLVVNGDLNLTGSTLNLSAIGPVSQATYVIVTYTGTLTGTFGTVTGLPTGYTLDYATTGQIKLVGPPASGYASWLTSYPGLSDTTQGGDPDKDGMINLLEYTLGGNPTLADTSVLPKLQVTATNFVFTFKRNDDSKSDTTQVFQWNTNLSSTWTEITIPVATSGSVTVVENGTAADDITVTIPRGTNVMMFGRLKVTAN